MQLGRMLGARDRALSPFFQRIFLEVYKIIRMTQSKVGGQGQNTGRDGGGAANGQGNSRGHGAGYTSKPKTLNVGLCKELENHIFD